MSRWNKIVAQSEWWVPLAGFSSFSGHGDFDLLDEAAGEKVRPEDMPLDWRFAAVAHVWSKAIQVLLETADDLEGSNDDGLLSRAVLEELCSSANVTSRLEWFYALPLIERLHELNAAELPGSQLELTPECRGFLSRWLSSVGDGAASAAQTSAAIRFALERGWDETASALIRQLAERTQGAKRDMFAQLVVDGLWPAQAFTAIQALDAPLPA